MPRVLFLRTLTLPALAMSVAALAPSASAQTIRFQTSVGAFDMLLNPTNNPNLQPLVDNMIANVAAGVYHRTVVNRAVDGFVLQIGSFQTDTVRVAETPIGGFGPTPAFGPVIVDADNNGIVDFPRAGLSNVQGTVSLALSAGNANSGSASFFINLASNTFLDGQNFIPFATIADMAPIDRILALEMTDLSDEVGQSGSLAYTDVPLAEDGDFVVIETAAVVSDSNISFVGPLQNAFGFAPFASLTGQPASSSLSASAAGSGGSSFAALSAAPALVSPGFVEEAPQSAAVPEPSSMALAIIGACCARPRQRNTNLR